MGRHLVILQSLPRPFCCSARPHHYLFADTSAHKERDNHRFQLEMIFKPHVYFYDTRNARNEMRAFVAIRCEELNSTFGILKMKIFD